VYVFNSMLVAAGLWGCADGATAPEAAIATTMEVASAVNFQGTVGAAVPDLPAVIIKDQHGRPVAGVRVAFNSKFGVNSLNTTESQTDAAGRASPDRWILATTAGTNDLLALYDNLRVEFHALGVPGPPATIEKVAGDNQLAFPRTRLVYGPTVRVRDQYSNPVSGAVVRFTVLAGDGSITADAVFTSSDGSASLGWTVGSDGAQALSASVQGLAPVTFTASVVTDRCTPFPIEARGDIPSGAFGSFGCTLGDGRVASLYSFHPTATGAYAFQVASDGASVVLNLTTKTGIPVAEAFTAGGQDGTIRVILAAGEYVLRVTPQSAGESPQYRLSAQVFDGEENDCRALFLTLGVKTVQTLAKGDCEEAHTYADNYWIFVEAGRRVAITMASDEVDNVIKVLNTRDESVVETHVTTDEGGAWAARATFEAPVTGYYRIVATTDYFPGSYTLAVDERKP
jgi:hypothetical protein